MCAWQQQLVVADVFPLSDHDGTRLGLLIGIRKPNLASPSQTSETKSGSLRAFSCTEAVVVAAAAQKKSRKSLSLAQKLEAVAAYKLKAKSKLRQAEEERPGSGGRQ
jgi:hypothetical protein